jgi:hypothetical protein
MRRRFCLFATLRLVHPFTRFDGLVVHARRCLCLPSHVTTVKVE